MRFLCSIALFLLISLLLLELIFIVISHLLTVLEQVGNFRIKKAQRITILQMHHDLRDIMKRVKKGVRNISSNSEISEKNAHDLEVYLQVFDKGIQLCETSQRNTDLKPVFPSLEETTLAQRMITHLPDGQQ